MPSDMLNLMFSMKRTVEGDLQMQPNAHSPLPRHVTFSLQSYLFLYFYFQMSLTGRERDTGPTFPQASPSAQLAQVLALPVPGSSQKGSDGGTAPTPWRRQVFTSCPAPLLTAQKEPFEPATHIWETRGHLRDRSF